MMSFKQWLALLGIYTIYMLIGAAVFISLEKDNELAGREELRDLKGRVIGQCGVFASVSLIYTLFWFLLCR